MLIYAMRAYCWEKDNFNAWSSVSVYIRNSGIAMHYFIRTEETSQCATPFTLHILHAFRTIGRRKCKGGSESWSIVC